MKSEKITMSPFLCNCFPKSKTKKIRKSKIKRKGRNSPCDLYFEVICQNLLTKKNYGKPK